MPKPGDVIFVGPNGRTPPAPAGTHWVEIGLSGPQGTEFILVSDDVGGLGGLSQALQDAFNRGLQLLLNQSGGTGDKAHQSVVFNGTTSPWKMTWTPTDDFFIVGCTFQAGMAISLNPSYANFAAIVAVAGILSDVLLLLPVSSAASASIGDCQIPVFKNIPLTVYGNVAGGFQVFLLPQAKQT